MSRIDEIKARLSELDKEKELLRTALQGEMIKLLDEGGILNFDDYDGLHYYATVDGKIYELVVGFLRYNLRKLTLPIRTRYIERYMLPQSLSEADEISDWEKAIIDSKIITDKFVPVAEGEEMYNEGHMMKCTEEFIREYKHKNQTI